LSGDVGPGAHHGVENTAVDSRAAASRLVAGSGVAGVRAGYSPPAAYGDGVGAPVAGRRYQVCGSGGRLPSGAVATMGPEVGLTGTVAVIRVAGNHGEDRSSRAIERPGNAGKEGR
jgi:hypothetical protein